MLGRCAPAQTARGYAAGKTERPTSELMTEKDTYNISDSNARSAGAATHGAARGRREGAKQQAQQRTLGKGVPTMMPRCERPHRTRRQGGRS